MSTATRTGAIEVPVGTIPDGGARLFRVDDDLTIALFRAGDDYFAIDDRCPHQKASLCGGEFRDGVVTCPAHGWQVDVRTGRGVAHRFLRVRRFDVTVADGIIRIDVPPAR